MYLVAVTYEMKELYSLTSWYVVKGIGPISPVRWHSVQFW